MDVLHIVNAYEKHNFNEFKKRCIYNVSLKLHNNLDGLNRGGHYETKF